ncbi:MAG: hypothetical protein AAF846_22985 [Chloroflexota bacterium]
MCRQLTEIARNDFKQAVFICEHDTLHLLNQYTTIVMTRYTFFALADFLGLGCLNEKNEHFQCTVLPDNSVELWIGKTAFRLIPAELISLTSLIGNTANYLRRVPLKDILVEHKSKKMLQNMKIQFSEN